MGIDKKDGVPVSVENVLALVTQAGEKIKRINEKFPTVAHALILLPSFQARLDGKDTEMFFMATVLIDNYIQDSTIKQ